MQHNLLQNVSHTHPLYPFLSHELIQLQNHLDRIKPRVKRSINFIGSAWKWIAGNPDHDDFEIIEQKMNNVLQSNNRQIVINKLSLEKINDLANATNKIVKVLELNEITHEHFVTTLKFKIELLKEELVNVQYAIHWAKSGIINSFILSNNEIDIVKQIFEKDQIPFTNLEEAFEFSEVKIACSNTSLIYIVNIPTTTINSCKKLLIKPTKFGKYVNKIEYKELLECKNSTFGIQKDCKSYNKLTICNINNVKQLNNDSCITNLLKSQPSNCTMIKNSNIPTVEEILPGMILLNQFNDSVYINDEQHDLSGTFILQFRNASITIENNTYNYFQVTEFEALPAILQPRLPGSKIEEVVTLETVKELNINNAKAIDLLDIRNKWSSATSLGLSVIAFIVIMFIVTKRRQEKNEIIASIPSVHLSLPELNTTNLKQIPRLSQIPYF